MSVADQLPARGGPGLHRRRRPGASRAPPRSGRSSRWKRRKTSSSPSRRSARWSRPRLQLLRQRPERRDHVRDAEAVGRAQRRGEQRERAGRRPWARLGSNDAMIFALSPPPIQELGNSSGFNFRLQDRAAARLSEAGRGPQPAARGPRRARWWSASARRAGGQPAAARRHRPDQGARARAVHRRHQQHPLDRFGSAYANDFNREGRVLRVVFRPMPPSA
jgi:hypothetical protein